MEEEEQVQGKADDSWQPTLENRCVCAVHVSEEGGIGACEQISDLNA